MKRVVSFGILAACLVAALCLFVYRTQKPESPQPPPQTMSPPVEPATAEEPAAQPVQEEPAPIEGVMLAEEPRSEESASISGRVTDEDGNPMDGAQLKLVLTFPQMSPTISPSPRLMRTEANGSYRITGIARKVLYKLCVSVEGYLPADRAVFLHENVGSTETEFNFVLQKAVLIPGRVTDTNGDPVGGAVVWAISTTRESRSGGLVVAPGHSGNTNEEGRFEIGVFAPDTYRFRVEVGDADSGYVQDADHDPISVQVGDRVTEVELVIEAANTGVIEGRVRDRDASDIADVKVSTTTKRGSTSRTKTGPSGQYRLERLAESPVDIHFFHPDYARASLENVPVGAMNADVVMLRMGAISGIVMDAGTRRPLESFEIGVLRLVDRNGVDIPRGNCRRRPDSPPGEFLIEDVSPGIATIRVAAPGYLPVEVAGILVESGKTTTGINVYLSRGATIEGYMTRNGAPVNTVATVTALPSGGSGEGPRETFVQNGLYRLELLPGAYSIVAHVYIAGRQGATTASNKVSLGPGQAVRLDFDVSGSGSVWGKVSAPEGYAVVGVIVHPSSVTEPFSFEKWASIQSEVLGWTQCSPDGTYEIPDLPAGSYNITAGCAPDWGSPPAQLRQTSRTVTIKEGESIEVNFDL